jgi:16S rRNA (uracil1498-N3)-methyltransferase
MTQAETDVLVSRDCLVSDRIGAIVTVVTPEGLEWRGRIVRTEGDYALVRLFERLFLSTESNLHITLVQALTKKEKMSFIIQKATELGVNRICPCVSSKGVGQGGSGRAQDKSHRWIDVAGRAVNQCRRRTIPVISQVAGFEDTIASFSDHEALRMILYEKEHDTRIKDVALKRPRPPSVVLACGPEGGFTYDEVRLAACNGFLPVSLGGRLLRCETAALASLAVVQHLWGDL